MAFIRLRIGAQYLYRWQNMQRKGQLCKLLVYAPRMDSVLVEFADGFKMVTSGKALAEVPANYIAQPRMFQ